MTDTDGPRNVIALYVQMHVHWLCIGYVLTDTDGP